MPQNIVQLTTSPSTSGPVAHPTSHRHESTQPEAPSTPSPSAGDSISDMPHRNDTAPPGPLPRALSQWGMWIAGGAAARSTRDVALPIGGTRGVGLGTGVCVRACVRECAGSDVRGRGMGPRGVLVPGVRWW